MKCKLAYLGTDRVDLLRDNGDTSVDQFGRDALLGRLDIHPDINPRAAGQDMASVLRLARILRCLSYEPDDHVGICRPPPVYQNRAAGITATGIPSPRVTTRPSRVVAKPCHTD